MTQQRHVIKQQILELDIGSDTNAFELQNQISALYRSQVVPIIEAICNQFSNSDIIHRIDRLEIDLGEIEAASLETDFAQKVAEALSNQLSQTLAANIVQSDRTISQTILDANSSQSTPSDIRHQIDRLVIDLGEIEAASLETDFAQKVAEALSNQLSQILATSTVESTAPAAPPIPVASLSQEIAQAKLSSLTSPAQARFELFQSFVQTGRLPWWSKPLNRNDLEECFYQLLAKSPDNLRALLQNGLKQETIMQRILYQFSEPMRMEMLKLLAPRLQPVFHAYLDDLQRLFPHVESIQRAGSQSVRQTLWQGLFLYLSLQLSFSYPTTEPEIDAVLRANLLHVATQLNLNVRSLIQQLLTSIEILASTGTHFTSELPQVLTTLALVSNAQEGSSEMSLKNEGDRDADAETISTNLNSGKIEDIYIQNAGVILLWPFLNCFFEILSLVKSGHFLSLQTAHRAILFLQYLVDTSLEPLEAALPLNKILCGLDISEPIPTSLTMTEDEQRECEGLLSAAIEHWSALGNTSIAGLRQAFLQRPGILRSHHEGWLLQVEQQTYDVLLDRIPWSIRAIKLPWMEQVLHTEW